jgi:hypothetical protein
MTWLGGGRNGVLASRMRASPEYVDPTRYGAASPLSDEAEVKEEEAEEEEEEEEEEEASGGCGGGRRVSAFQARSSLTLCAKMHSSPLPQPPAAAMKCLQST